MNTFFERTLGRVFGNAKSNIRFPTVSVVYVFRSDLLMHEFQAMYLRSVQRRPMRVATLEANSIHQSLGMHSFPESLLIFLNC